MNHMRGREHHRGFSRSHVQMGAHWLKTAGILAPLVIHEFVRDPDKKMALHPPDVGGDGAGVGGNVAAPASAGAG